MFWIVGKIYLFDINFTLPFVLIALDAASSNIKFLMN